MNVSPNELRKETVKTLKDVNAILEEVKDQSDILDVELGVVIPLLLAKVQCLNTLVLLNEPRK